MMNDESFGMQKFDFSSMTITYSPDRRIIASSTARPWFKTSEIRLAGHGGGWEDDVCEKDGA